MEIDQRYQHDYQEQDEKLNPNSETQPQPQPQPQPETTEAEHSNARHKRVIRLTFALLLSIILAYVITDSLTQKKLSTTLQHFLQWVEQNPITGIVAFIFVYILATIFFLPGSILTLGIGFIYAHTVGLGLGVVFASIAVFIGASIGAVMAFMVGRYLFRGRVEVLARKYPVMQAMDGALMRKGLRIMVLLRLSPLIPFNALNYVLGVMAVEGRDYVVALVAILPGTILYVFIGASAGSLVDGATTVNTVNTTNTTFDGDVDGGGRTVQIVTIVVGIVFGVLGIGAVSYYARKELNSTIETADHPEPNGGITIDIDNNNDGIEIVRQSQIISRV